MNGKTVKKLLMRSRTRVLWGQRAYLSVRLPANMVAEPCPPAVSFPGMVEDWQGNWSNPQNDNERIIIGKVYTNTPIAELDEPSFFTEEEDTPGWYSYWTGSRILKDGDSFSKIPLSKEIIAQQRAFVDWHNKLYEWGRSKHPVLDCLLQVHNHASSMNFTISQDYKTLYISYGVKWFRSNSKRRFSASLARAITLAHKQGIPARVLKG